MAAALRREARSERATGCRGWEAPVADLPIAVVQGLTAVRSGPGEMMRPADWPIRLSRGRIERVRGQRDPFGLAPNPARAYLSSGRASTTTNIGSCRVQPVR
jgi:hypothetical protein